MNGRAQSVIQYICASACGASQGDGTDHQNQRSKPVEGKMSNSNLGRGSGWVLGPGVKTSHSAAEARHGKTRTESHGRSFGPRNQGTAWNRGQGEMDGALGR
jgi:hypothetical protein